MRIVHMGDLGRKGPGGRRGGWGGWGYGYGPWWDGGYAEPLENKFVLIDPSGKPIAVVKGPPQVPAGWSFRVATPTEAALNKPEGLSDYIVRGPEGEVYGRYATKPTPDQIPLYAIAEEEKPGWLGGNSIF
jgi:hypothetical protein